MYESATTTTTILTNLFCNGSDANIYLLSRKCLESVSVYETFDCKRWIAVHSNSMDLATHVIMTIGTFGGIVGNLITLIALPYARKQNRFELQTECRCLFDLLSMVISGIIIVVWT